MAHTILEQFSVNIVMPTHRCNAVISLAEMVAAPDTTVGLDGPCESFLNGHMIYLDSSRRCLGLDIPVFAHGLYTAVYVAQMIAAGLIV